MQMNLIRNTEMWGEGRDLYSIAVVSSTKRKYAVYTGCVCCPRTAAPVSVPKEKAVCGGRGGIESNLNKHCCQMAEFSAV